MVLSIGAATRKVRGGRFRSTRSGFLAQLPTSPSASPAMAIQPRDRANLCKDIQISPRRRRHRQVFLGTGELGTPSSYQAARGAVNEFCICNEKGRRCPGGPVSLKLCSWNVTER